MEIAVYVSKEVSEKLTNAINEYNGIAESLKDETVFIVEKMPSVINGEREIDLGFVGKIVKVNRSPIIREYL